MPESIDLLIDLCLFFNIGVRNRHIRLRLVVVVVGDKVVDGVVGKEVAVLLRELGSERLVVRNNECRLLHLLDNVRRREGLPRAGHTEERLVRHTRLIALHQLLNRLRLIPRRCFFCREFEFHLVSIAKNQNQC